MSNIFQQGIETHNCGMAGGTSFYDIEDLYQAFKERLTEELRVQSDCLPDLAELVDVEDRD